MIGRETSCWRAPLRERGPQRRGAANGDAIPLAPTLLMNGGLTADVLPGLCVQRDVGSAAGCFALPGKQTTGHLDPATGRRVDPRDDVHFTPGNPFGIHAGLELYF